MNVIIRQIAPLIEYRYSANEAISVEFSVQEVTYVDLNAAKPPNKCDSLGIVIDILNYGKFDFRSGNECNSYRTSLWITRPNVPDRLSVEFHKNGNAGRYG